MAAHPGYAIAIHGGAGDLPYWGMTPEKEKQFHAALVRAVEKGLAILKRDGSALDAVEAALIELENEPLFNAGVGSAINSAGKVQMDASIMCGRTMKAGAVAGIGRYRNPFQLARLVMDRSGHVFLAGEGAEMFAREMGLEAVSNEHFKIAERIAWWEDENRGKASSQVQDTGTAGAVALDRQGNLAAATSTGGLMMTRPGRIGDSPVIGAGTYANNDTCAVSCSGAGENIIRAVTAHEISALLKYGKMSLADACEKTMQEKVTPFGGQAGLVALDHEGNIKYVFNTKRMYRGWYHAGEIITRLYPE